MSFNTLNTKTLGLTNLHEVSEPTKILNEGCIRLLRYGGPMLRKLTVSEIAHRIEKICNMWLDPNFHYRRAVVERIVEETGMSSPVVEHGLDIEMSNYTSDSLLNTLKSEIGNPKFLDGFQANSFIKGLSRVYGPKLTAYWFSSTIPALPALSMIRGLLLKSPAIGRISQREQFFAPAFLLSLKEVFPDIEQAIWLTTWSPELFGCLEVLAKRCDAAIIYGSKKTCTFMRPKLAPFLKMVEHGHRIGLTLIGSDVVNSLSLPSLAESCAYDITTFDQRACISPQVYLVENNEDASTDNFAKALANSLQIMESRYPASTRSIDEKVAIFLAKKEVELRGGYALQAGSCWVLVEKNINGALPTIGHRVIRIVPVDDLEIALKELPFLDNLQNVALNVRPEIQNSLMETLAELGASRICRAGKMPYPTMTWHHDGMACLGQLVRWLDVEI